MIFDGLCVRPALLLAVLAGRWTADGPAAGRRTPVRSPGNRRQFAAGADGAPRPSAQCQRSVAGAVGTRPRGALDRDLRDAGGRGEAVQGRRLCRRAGARHASGARGHGAGDSRRVLHGSRASSGSVRSRRRAARFDALLDRKPPGYVAIAAALASGEAAEAAGDYDGALSASTNGSPTRRPPSPTTCCRGSARAALAVRRPGKTARRPTCASTTSSR